MNHLTNQLEKVAKQLVSPEKGILAADWSLGSSQKQFEKNGIEHTEENRRKYRQMLFTTPDLEKYISGVIFFEETLKQSTDDRKPFPKLLEEKGIIPGIKVDKGAKDMANFPGEKITEGLDGLRDRLKEYYDLGARFAKWRGVITIADMIPTNQNIRSNAEALARYAALSQEAGMVPVVDPEVVMAGGHDIARDEEVTRKTLIDVFSALEKHRVKLEGVILKTNFVHKGSGSQEKDDFRLVAEETFQTLERAVPPQVPGIVFLSGGIRPKDASAHLNELAKVALEDKNDAPWEITFSYARAIQYPGIEIWGGNDDNYESAQKAFAHRAKMNSLARQGKYDPKLEEAS